MSKDQGNFDFSVHDPFKYTTFMVVMFLCFIVYFIYILLDYVIGVTSPTLYANHLHKKCLYTQFIVLTAHTWGEERQTTHIITADCQSETMLSSQRQILPVSTA